MKYKSKANWDDDYPMIPDLSVDYSPAQRTGLLDKHGNEIYRVPERIGFRVPKREKAKTK